MPADDFRTLERQLILQIAIKNREIAHLQSEKAVLERLLYKARKQEISNREVTRSNSVGRVMAENAIMAKIDAGPKMGVSVTALELAARGAVPGLGQSTFRSHIYRLRERGIIESPTRGVWRRASSTSSDSVKKGQRMDVWFFFGRDGNRALSLRRDGDNLPTEFGPWQRFRIVPAPEEALLDLKTAGYWMTKSDEQS